jgi:2-polyprenyl-3-methyl-5-hydroxy-6-metoxy-1,4-benzoquinol methylase
MNGNAQIVLDIVSPRRIAGWCTIPERPNVHLKMEFVDKKGNVVSSCLANKFRQDLADANVADGSGNFSFDEWGNFSEVKEIRASIPVIVPTPNYDSLGVSSKDSLFWGFYYQYNGFEDGGVAAAQNYLDDGMNSAEQFHALCANVLRLTKKRNVLQFNSGFGSVTRYIDSNRFNVTASDISADALNFVKENFGTKTYLATTPDAFAPPEKYDVVFALSAFAHMDKPDFDAWLKALFNCLAPNGFLIFTTHGETSNTSMQYELDGGFAYEVNESNSERVLISDFGASVATKEYVENAIKRVLNTQPLISKMASWWGHQDMYIVRALMHRTRG